MEGVRALVFLSIVILFCWTPVVNGGRILFFLPLSSKSMCNVFEPLAKALSERGHELTLVTSMKFKIDSENVTHYIWHSHEELYNDYPDPFDTRRANKLFAFPIPFQQKYCHRIYQNREFQQIAHQKFDLVFLNLIHHDCFAGAIYKMGAPIVFVGTLPMPSQITEIMGNPMPSSTIPICVLWDISDPMSFIQRTKNFLYNAYFSVHLEIMVRPYLEEVYRQYLGKDVPSIREIYKRQASFLFQNSHYALTNPRPLLPSVVEIGGIHCKDAKPLPKDLEEFVSGAEHGFIVFSLGSIVHASKMPESVRLAFLNTFAKLKQRVIWKWEKEEGMPDVPKNVKVVKWLPQQDLLGHPNIRLFITHGGFLSTEEAIYHGVPVLGTPVFVDQDANMRQAEIHGFGLKAEILDITQAKLEPLVRKILDEPRYMERAKNLSKIFRDQPHTSLEGAVFWTEYALRHKGAYHLRSSAMYLNPLQYHCVDVVAFLVAIVISLLLFIYYIFKLIIVAVKLGVYETRKKKKIVIYKKKRH